MPHQVFSDRRLRLLPFLALLALPIPGPWGSGSARADVGQHNGRQIFIWPSKAAGGDVETRKRGLADQIAQYSRLAGSMRSAPRHPNDPFWANRKKIVENILPRNCDGVRRTLVEKLFKDSMSGYYQYGNCGEGAVVTICLAKQFGFPKQDVLHCQNRYKNSNPDEVPRIKHQFGVLRLGDTWGLLDRWNRFQTGLKLEPIIVNGQHLRAKHDPSRKLYRLTTPSGGNFFAGARVSEEIEAKVPTYW